MRRWIAVALTLCVSSALGEARADDVERSVELGRAGLELYTTGDWAGCAAKFSEASQLAQSPVFLLYQGRCLRNGRKLIGAREALSRVTAFELPADAPPSWRQSKTDAQVELATLGASIPSILVEITGATPSELRLDGTLISAPGPIDLDPGTHRISAISGERATETSFVIEPGMKEKKVLLSFDKKPDIGIPPRRVTPPVAPDAEGSLLPGVVITSIGGSALLVGAILGGVAAMQFGDIEERCGGDPTAPESCTLPADQVRTLQSDLDDTNLIADTATGLLIGGGVVSAVGVVLLIVQPGGGPVSADARGFSLSF